MKLMQLPVFSVLSFTLLVLHVKCLVKEEEYSRMRNALLAENQKSLLGSSTTLEDPREVTVNKILMSNKDREFEVGIESHGKHFPAAQHFLKAKDKIDSSDVFKIIKLLPKGGNLHTHLDPAVDLNFVIQNLTKLDNLYYCVKQKDSDQELLFRYSEKELVQGCATHKEWKKMDEFYREAGSVELGQAWLFSNMNPYSDSESAWTIFEQKIRTVSSLISYEEAMKAAFYNILLEHYNNNIMYIEVKAMLHLVYRLNQTMLSPRESLALFKDVTDKFMADYPDFWGAKFISVQHRFLSKEKIQKFIDESIELHELFPDFSPGFDVVGQEDKGAPLKNFIPHFLRAIEKDVKFFFHAGETGWYGTSIDENLLDAILLNTSRIGHGFALYRHPLLYEMVKNRSIAVEVCPISNQILLHVEDLRVHPAAAYFREGFPVVVASDDAGLWGASPLSHDWYITFMAIAGQRADLRFLKQLAKNSILYSVMSHSEKQTCLRQWERKWSEFLDKVIELYG